ncbi:MAG: dihydropteroate synthase [Chloroflexi bacterium]|nr:MAG: dihydropteroate synthase [Chloroflexota bacterium]
MILIGESIHIISREVSTAIKERNPRVIQDLAVAQAEAGADYIDLNVGPARKDPEDLMKWIVNVVQEAVDLPLSIDTMNPVAMEAGLKLCKKRPLLNSASNKTESKQQMLPLAKKYDCDVVLSVFADYGMPADVDMRVSSILEAAEYANSLGIPNEDIWVDPIVLPISTAGEGQAHAKAVLEFIQILPELLPGVKSTLGLSNVSNGTPKELRPLLNRTFLLMLQRNGLYSAIADVLDKELVQLSKGEFPEIAQLIYRVMDGEEVDLSSLSREERDYVKTAEVLVGKTLYSDAWLET